MYVGDLLLMGCTDNTVADAAAAIERTCGDIISLRTAAAAMGRRSVVKVVGLGFKSQNGGKGATLDSLFIAQVCHRSLRAFAGVERCSSAGADRPCWAASA